MLPLNKTEVDRIIDNNLVDEFDRLRATPGFVLVPMPFEKVNNLESTAFEDARFLKVITTKCASGTGTRACQYRDFRIAWSPWPSSSTHQNI